LAPKSDHSFSAAFFNRRTNKTERLVISLDPKDIISKAKKNIPPLSEAERIEVEPRMNTDAQSHRIDKKVMRTP